MKLRCATATKFSFDEEGRAIPAGEYLMLMNEAEEHLGSIEITPEQAAIILVYETRP